MKKILLFCTAVCILAACSSTSDNKTSENKEDSTVIEQNPATGNDVKLSTTDKRALDTFFSNFAEVGLGSFTQSDGIKNEEMINFGILHNYINKRKVFVNVDENTVKIKKEYIEESVNKYFGKKSIKHKSIEGVAYSNGYYTMPLADGETFRFAQIAKLVDLGSQKFEAQVNVFSASSGWTGDTHANPSAYATTDIGDAPSVDSKVKAILLKDEKGKYTLLEYVKHN